MFGWCLLSSMCMGGIFARKVEKVAQLCPIQSQYESRAHFGNFWPENDQKQKFGLRRGFFGPNQKVQKTKYVFTRPIHPPEVVSNQNFEIGTLSPPSIYIAQTATGTPKGTGDFEWCRQTMDELCVFGTSRTSNELKSGP